MIFYLFQNLIIVFNLLFSKVII